MNKKTGELWRRVLALLIAVVFCYGIIEPASAVIALEDEALVEDVQEEDADVEDVEEIEDVEDVEDLDIVEEEAAEAAEEAEEAEEAEAEEEAEEEAAEPEEDVEVADAPAEEAEVEEEIEITEAESYQAGTYTYDGADYTVTVSYDETACLPEGTELVVSEIAEGAAAYNQYYNATENAVAAGENTEIKEVRFFDIAFVADGVEIEPQAPVSVTVKFQYGEAVSDGGKVSVVHMSDEAEVISSNAYIAAEENEVTATFANDEFSVYGFAYTVDFTYNEYVYSLDGEGSILLSELFAALGIDADVADVAAVEYSDPEQLAIELQEDGDYLITSLKPFETDEKLTITMKDGTVYVIDVTDPPATDNTTVDHIDIGVTAAASITVPLAYGKYYNADGENVIDLNVGDRMNVKGVNKLVPITADDLREAGLTAKRGGEDYTNFTVGTNYTDDYGIDPHTGERIEQLRIPGRFGTGTLDNPVTYSMTVTKEFEVTLQYEGEDLYNEDGEKVTITVVATLISSFTFFDEGNMCPGIVNGSNVNGNVDYTAGMDFILGTSDDTNGDLTAIDIVKYIVNEDGDTIKTEDTYDFTFDVYQNTSGDVTAPAAWGGETSASVDYSGYSKLNDRTLTTSKDGLGIVYDYDVADPALIYIVENEDSIPKTIKDENGNTLIYDHTYIETEYAWRGDGGETHSNVNQDDQYKSIPDVVGDYYSDSTDEDLRNTFLEFYVYNVYKPETTEITVTKEWDDEDDNDGIRPDSVTIILEGSDGSSVEVELDGKADDEPEDTDPVGYEAEEWTAKFINLPVSNSDGEITYTATEKESDPVTGEDAAGTYAYEVSGSAEDGFTVTNTHTPIKTTFKVTKEWEDEDDKDGIRPNSISVQLTANGDAYGDPVDLTADDDWTYTWEELPGYEDGEAIEYNVEEPELPEGYTAEIGEVSGDAENGYELTITNTHEPEEEPEVEPIEVEIEATKKLVDSKDDSKEYELEEGEFEFELEIDGEVVATEKNDADGKITFTYEVKEAGEYSFKISEVKGSEEGVEYDETVFEGTITVEENEDGELEATVEGADEIEFVNKYTEEEEEEEEEEEPTTPPTGDNSRTWLWLIVMLAAGLELASLIYVRVRKNNR